MSYTRKSIYAVLPSTTRGQPTQLSGDPKGKNFLYTNGRSVIIRDIEVRGDSFSIFIYLFKKNTAVGAERPHCGPVH